MGTQYNNGNITYNNYTLNFPSKSGSLATTDDLPKIMFNGSGGGSLSH